MRTAGAVHYLGLGEVGHAIARGELSSETVTAGLLERIAELNPQLGAYYTVFGESALEEARRADAEIADGRHRGPLHGVPIAFKDLYQLGLTTAGSAVLKDNRPDREAALVTRMREAGAVILGKLATHEFALAAATESDHFPPARNPWNQERSPGGSSTGAGTALAAGLAFGAWGTDTGGSVRIPAAHCGVAGYKPTYGLLDLAGVIPLAWSLDHAGPMARSVPDLALMFNAAGVPAEMTAEAGVQGLRIGVPRGFWADGCDPQVAAAVEVAIERFAALGATTPEVDLGLTPADVIATGYLVTMGEAAAHHRVNLRRHGPEYGREFRLVLKTANLIPASAYVDAQRARRAVAAAVERALSGCDVLLLPTVGALADPIPAGPRPLQLRISATPAPVYTWLANVYGGPAVSVPCGFSVEGLPIGLQVLGRQLDDSRVLSAAAAYEAASEWSGRRPLP